MSSQEFIQQVISGDATNASETFKTLLSKKIYESLLEKKVEMGVKFFNETSNDDEEDEENEDELTDDEEEDEEDEEINEGHEELPLKVRETHRDAYADHFQRRGHKIAARESIEAVRKKHGDWNADRLKKWLGTSFD